jgi:SAM-dependent methyltransferase
MAHAAPITPSGQVNAGSAPRPGSGDPGVVYALGSSPAEQERIRRQPDELREDSQALLDLVGIAAGWSAIDLGCGPAGILDLLVERVGPAGRVTGLDLNPASIAQARELARERGYHHVELVVGDARNTSLPSGSYDLVHARTLLVNAPDPAAVLTEMVRLARPGGWVAVLEPDSDGSICYPPHPAWDRMIGIWQDAASAYGLDAHIGRRLPELFRQVGLTGIAIEARAHIYPHGHSRRTIRADLLRSMHDQILAKGIAGEQELDEVDRAVRKHLASPDTLVLPNLLFLAWGRKQANPQ